MVLTNFFPDYEVKKGEITIFDVTIRHLLTMTAPHLKLGERFGYKLWISIVQAF